MTRGMEVTLEPTRCAHRWAGRRSSRVLAHWPTLSRSHSSRRRPFDFLRERRASVAVCPECSAEVMRTMLICVLQKEAGGQCFKNLEIVKLRHRSISKPPSPPSHLHVPGCSRGVARPAPLTAFLRHAPTPARRPAPACHLQVRSGVLVRGGRRERRILNVVTSLPTQSSEPRNQDHAKENQIEEKASHADAGAQEDGVACVDTDRPPLPVVAAHRTITQS